MFKSKSDQNIVNTRNVRTRLHDALVFNMYTKKPNYEKYRGNVFYSGAISWNMLPARIHNTETYDVLNNYQKQWALGQP